MAKISKIEIFFDLYGILEDEAANVSESPDEVIEYEIK